MRCYFPPSLTGAILLLAVNGCHDAQVIPDTPIIRLDASYIGGRIDMYVSGRIVHTLAYRFREPIDAGLLEKVYVSQSSQKRVRKLWSVLCALQYVDAPKPQRLGPGATLEVLLKPDLMAKWELPYRALEAHPLWRGLCEECVVVARHDLVSALFHKELAETYARHNLPARACADYRVSLEKLVRWSHHELLLSRDPEAYVDDSDIVVSEPLSLINSRLHEEALGACRDAWKILTEDVTLEHETDGTVTVIIREPEWMRE